MNREQSRKEPSKWFVIPWYFQADTMINIFLQWKANKRDNIKMKSNCQEIIFTFPYILETDRLTWIYFYKTFIHFSKISKLNTEYLL